VAWNAHFSAPNGCWKERVRASAGAEAHQPTFTFSSKQRSACSRQVSWLSGRWGRSGLPRFRVALEANAPHRLQWRDRAGFSPASLFSPPKRSTCCKQRLGSRRKSNGISFAVRRSSSGKEAVLEAKEAATATRGVNVHVCRVPSPRDEWPQGTMQAQRQKSHSESPFPPPRHQDTKTQSGLFADGDIASSGQIYGVNGQFEQVEKPPSLAMICPVM
jgi:hypothetical protein